MTIEEVIEHVRNRSYMSGVERDRVRILKTQEVFTPTDKVRELLNEYQDQFKDNNQTFLDPSCGDGQFLGEVLIRKMENGSTFEQALSTIYGVEFMQDNVEECRRRLLCGQEHLRHIVEKNIICHDALTYDYSFNGTDKNQTDLTWDQLFSSD
jgi:type I restriction-modification system DNA methylase subunit